MDFTEKGYWLKPEKYGFSYTSNSTDDIKRKMLRTLYPDSDKNNFFTPSEKEKLKKMQIRTAVRTALAPSYMLDLHSLAGIAGFGRFVLTISEKTLYLDEAENIYTEYTYGSMRYVITDSSFIGKIEILIVPTAQAAGFVGSISVSDSSDVKQIFWLHGGIPGINPGSPNEVPYNPEVPCGNVLYSCGKKAELAVNGKDGEKYGYEYKCQENTADFGYPAGMVNQIIPEFNNSLQLKISDGKIYGADPESYFSFRFEKLTDSFPVKNVLFCAEFDFDKSNSCLFAAGIGNGMLLTLNELMSISLERVSEIGEATVLETADYALDSAATIETYANEATFAGDTYVHGLLSWRNPYLGWRNAFGPLDYGFTKNALTHFLTHFDISLITEGPDAGALVHILDAAAPDAVMFYAMYETFIHQASYYLHATNDVSFKEKLAPVLEGCIERSIRRLKAGDRWLFENSMNTWISDSHWNPGAQCTQSSAYTYYMTKLASAILPDADKRKHYSEIADNIYRDAHEILWQKRKGTFAFSQETDANKQLHGEPELPDIYHSFEMGLCDRYEAYQMLDYAEANIRQEKLMNGGRLFWSSDWHPNSGDSYTHSTYDLAPQENYNFALVYFGLGLAEEGYDIFKSMYQTMFGGPEPVDEDQNDEQYKGRPKSVRNIAGGMPGHVFSTGASRRGVEFTDAISMFGRTLHEGIFGIYPERDNGKIRLVLSLPEELGNSVQIKSSQLSYSFEKTEQENEKSIRLNYGDSLGDSDVEINMYIPVSAVKSFMIDGKDADFTVKPAFGKIMLISNLPSHGELVVTYEEIPVAPVEKRRNISRFDKISLKYPSETIETVYDPEGLLNNINIIDDVIEAEVCGSAGSGVFFLEMNAYGVNYTRPVKINIDEPVPDKSFHSPDIEYPGEHEFVTIPMKEYFNASSPDDAMDTIYDEMPIPELPHNRVGAEHFHTHYRGYNNRIKDKLMCDQRWKEKINENGIAVTDESIPFLSEKNGNYLAVTTLQAKSYPDRITVPVNEDGRAVYLLVTGVTFPMESHVENLRITLIYDDGSEETNHLVCPYDIGDGWFTCWGRFHDTPNAGFENLSGHWGAMSSVGQDLSKAIMTDTEAYILRYRLRKGSKLKSVEFRTIARSSAFALMGITVLK